MTWLEQRRVRSDLVSASYVRMPLKGRRPLFIRFTNSQFLPVFWSRAHRRSFISARPFLILYQGPGTLVLGRLFVRTNAANDVQSSDELDVVANPIDFTRTEILAGSQAGITVTLLKSSTFGAKAACRFSKQDFRCVRHHRDQWYHAFSGLFTKN